MVFHHFNHLFTAFGFTEVSGKVQCGTRVSIIVAGLSQRFDLQLSCSFIVAVLNFKYKITFAFFEPIIWEQTAHQDIQQKVVEPQPISPLSVVVVVACAWVGFCNYRKCILNVKIFENVKIYELVWVKKRALNEG